MPTVPRSHAGISLARPPFITHAWPVSLNSRNLNRACLLITLLTASLVLSAAGIDPDNQHITLSLTSEPPNLDTSLSEDTTSALILRLTNEGLVRVDRRGRIIPGVAERWQVEGRQITFWLRDDARWSDGVPVKASDFVYAWRRLVTPATAAGGSAFYVYLIKNGAAILAGDMPPESLGITAPDDRTIVVSLSQTAPFALSVFAGTAYMPLRQDFVESREDRYAADAVDLLSNGPFSLDSWVHNASMQLTRNENYWDKNRVNLNAIDIGYITADLRSLYNLYKSGELAALDLDENTMKMAANDGKRVRTVASNCVAWVTFNTAPGHPTSHTTIRRALRMAFDRDRFVNNIVALPGTRKVESPFTHHIRGLKKPFIEEYPPTEIQFDVAGARRLLQQGLDELGLERLPPLILLANETRQIEAEYIQSQLMEALDIEIRVDKQTFKQSLVKAQSGQFDIARVGFCSGSVMDPTFFARIFHSKGSYNDGRYANPQYDELLAFTDETNDVAARMDAFGQLQQLLYDDAPIIPIYSNATVYVEDPRLKGMMRFPFSDFSGAKITP